MEGSVPCGDPFQIQVTAEGSVSTDSPAVAQAKPESNKKQGLEMVGSLSTEWTDEMHSSHLNSIEASYVKQLNNKEYCSMDLSREWTDEMHSSHLNSIEASFVKQLYKDCCSMDLRHWLSRRKKLLVPKSAPSNANSPTGCSQFKVLQGGCIQKLNFERTLNRLDIGNKSQVLLANPWIQHFRSGSTSRGLEVTPSYPLENNSQVSDRADAEAPTYRRATSGLAATHFKQFSACFHMHPQDFVGSNVEASDQNFTNEDCDEEGVDSSGPDRKRRLKATPVDASDKDQVVPFERYPYGMNVNEDKKLGNCIGGGQLERLNGCASSQENDSSNAN